MYPYCFRAGITIHLLPVGARSNAYCPLPRVVRSVRQPLTSNRLGASSEAELEGDNPIGFSLDQEVQARGYRSLSSTGMYGGGGREGQVCGISQCGPHLASLCRYQSPGIKTTLQAHLEEQVSKALYQYILFICLKHFPLGCIKLEEM